MNLLLIPVADGLPAIREHFERYPNDEAVSAEELRELCVLAVRYVRVSELLCDTLSSSVERPGKTSRSF